MISNSQSNSTIINIASQVPFSKIHGPGLRFVIWVQGCSLHCKGCANTDLWDFNGGSKKSIASLIDEIKNTPNIEGVTITGGEPFDQILPVSILIKEIHKLNLTIVVFTGYTLEEIEKDPRKKDLFLNTDIVITGRYEKEKNSINLRWRGSSNQIIYYHNAQYEKKYGKASETSEFEVHIDEKGEIILTGFPDLKIKEMI